MSVPFRKLTITYQTENKRMTRFWSLILLYCKAILCQHCRRDTLIEGWSTEEITFKLQIIDLIIVFGRKMYTPENIMQVLVSEANS
jgi:hypothetical protein